MQKLLSFFSIKISVYLVIKSEKYSKLTMFCTSEPNSINLDSSYFKITSLNVKFRFNYEYISCNKHLPF